MTNVCWSTTNAAPGHTAAAALILWVAIFTGCSSEGDAELVSVKGRVLLDGAPLAKGAVITIPAQGRGARGEIDADGRFELTTGDLGPGAVVGLHHVGVVATDAASDATNPEAPRTYLVPPQYANPELSGLTIEVKAQGENAPTLELSSKPQ
jgi:hypothetical protein